MYISNKVALLLSFLSSFAIIQTTKVTNMFLIPGERQKVFEFGQYLLAGLVDCRFYLML